MSIDNDDIFFLDDPARWPRALVAVRGVVGEPGRSVAIDVVLDREVRLSRVLTIDDNARPNVLDGVPGTRLTFRIVLWEKVTLCPPEVSSAARHWGRSTEATMRCQRLLVMTMSWPGVLVAPAAPFTPSTRPEARPEEPLQGSCLPDGTDPGADIGAVGKALGRFMSVPNPLTEQSPQPSPLI